MCSRLLKAQDNMYDKIKFVLYMIQKYRFKNT